MSEDSFLIVTGNPVKGYQYFGPFPDEDEAIEWAMDTFKDPYWWTASITEPDYDFLDLCSKCGHLDPACQCDDNKVIEMPVPDYVLDGA